MWPTRLSAGHGPHRHEERARQSERPGKGACFGSALSGSGDGGLNDRLNVRIVAELFLGWRRIRGLVVVTHAEICVRLWEPLIGEEEFEMIALACRSTVRCRPPSS